MDRRKFEKIVQDALDALPKLFKDKLENIDVVINDRPPRGPKKDLLGLYEGVPQGERGAGYSFVMHDRITLFKKNIEKECQENDLDIRDEIRQTVLHEIAHHFGFSDEDLEKKELY